MSRDLLTSLSLLWEEVEKERFGVADPGVGDLLATNDGALPRFLPGNLMLPVRLFLRLKQGTVHIT